MANIQDIYSSRPSIADAIANSAKKSNDRLNVAELCKVTSILQYYSDPYAIMMIRPLTTTDTSVENTYVAYCFDPYVQTGDIVLAVFTNTDFRQGLNATDIPVKINQIESHSKSSAVIVPLK